MHTEIRFYGDQPKVKERRIIPARSPRHEAETLRQLRELHLDFIRRKRALLERIKLR